MKNSWKKILMTENNLIPKISVMIGCHNFEKYIGECIESVINQTIQPCEILIFDDASKDASQEIIKGYSDKYPDLIKIYLQNENIGPAKNGNKVFAMAKGDFVSWLDGDDYWDKRKLEYEINALRNNPEANIAYSNFNLVEENGKIIRTIGDGAVLPEGNVFFEAFCREIFPNESMIFRSFLKRIDDSNRSIFFDESLDSHWDFDEFLALTKTNKAVSTGKCTMVYRKHPEGFSSVHSSGKYVHALKLIYNKHLSALDGLSYEKKLYARLKNELYFTFNYIKYGFDFLKDYSKDIVLPRFDAEIKENKKEISSEFQDKIDILYRKFNNDLIDLYISRGRKFESIKIWLASFSTKNLFTLYSLKFAVKLITPVFSHNTIGRFLNLVAVVCYRK